ncbi:recombinase family protein [Bradyrhizobium sp. CCBAU 53338]|uniref:recombinase family protein n=1 Tax=Bradyrhizobium sp. CCBAU 53338 TaxID=1325111 RepID=UPI00188BAB09|nr:recombinase family protein [Bradyrhizobium sp. CCBAU 53338]
MEKAFLLPPAAFIGPGSDVLNRSGLRALGYLRNSEGEFESSTSLIRQVEPIITFARQREMLLQRVFADPDTFGEAIFGMPNMLRAIAVLRSGLADVLLIDEETRLARGGWLYPIHVMLAKQGIPIITTGRGVVLTDAECALSCLAATREINNIAKRTSSGHRINAQHRNKITKRLRHGHYRPHKGEAPQIHPLYGNVVQEIFAMFDQGRTASNIITYLNSRWKAGDEAYKPPGKAELWERNHLVGNKAQDGGLLRCKDFIGEFWHGKTINWTDNGSAAPMMIEAPVEDHYKVEDPKLAIIKDRALFDRVQERLARNSGNYLKRNAPKKEGEKQTRLSGRYSSDGSGRRLLTSTVSCGACGVYRFNYKGEEANRAVMKCAGSMGRGSCSSHFRLDADRLTQIVLTVLGKEISSDGAIERYAAKLSERNAGTIQVLKASEEDTRKELALLKAEHKSLLVEMAPLSGTARESYSERRHEIETKMRVLDHHLILARDNAASKAGAVRKTELRKCTDLLERLRQPATYSSKKPADLDIVETVRRMLDIHVTPHDHDYGATAYVTIDLSCFFETGPVQPDLKISFEVVIPPREKGFREIHPSKIDLAMFEEPEKHRMDDATWNALSEVLRPHWDRKLKYFFERREFYEAMFLNLKAGGTPSTTHNPNQDYTPMSLIHSNMRVVGVWPAVLQLLKNHGETWVDGLAPALLMHLHGVGGRPDADWVVSETQIVSDLLGDHSSDSDELAADDFEEA